MADEKGIKIIHATGGKPIVWELFIAIMANLKVRELVKNYQESNEDEGLYAISVREGVSGCQDIYFEKAVLKAGEHIIKRRHLCHITMYDKLEDEVVQFSMREFIEFIKYSKIDIIDPAEMLEESKTQILKYRDIDERFSGPSNLPL